MCPTLVVGSQRSIINLTPVMDKTTLFSIALKSAGLSMGHWIAQTLDPIVSESFVYAVLKGDKSSARVEAAIDGFLEDQRFRIQQAFAAAA